MNPLKNIFGKKNQDDNAPQAQIADEETIIRPLEKKEESFAPKSIKKVVRGPGGKFVSKNPAKKVNQPKAISAATAPVSKEPELTVPNYQISTFYGKSIGRIYKENAWRFSLIDVLSLTSIDDTKLFLEKLEEKLPVKKDSDGPIKQIEFSDENGTKMVDCITYEGFLTLLPIIRESGHIFAGPFPDWLKEVSNLPSA